MSDFVDEVEDDVDVFVRDDSDGNGGLVVAGRGKKLGVRRRSLVRGSLRIGMGEGGVTRAGRKVMGVGKEGLARMPKLRSCGKRLLVAIRSYYLICVWFCRVHVWDFKKV